MSMYSNAGNCIGVVWQHLEAFTTALTYKSGNFCVDNNHFAPLSAIKTLREEVGKYHQMTGELEEEYRSLTNNLSSHHQELEKIKDEIKVA